MATGTVCLTACSDLLKEAEASQLVAAKPEVVAPVVAAQSEAKRMPDTPPHLVKCIQRDVKKGETANDKVVALKQAAEERKACALAILAWYKSVQAEQKKVAAAIKASGSTSK
jgi:hypothetical protein